MSAVEKRLALKRLLVLTVLKDVFKGKSKNTGKILGQTDFSKNIMKKDNFLKILFRLRSNKLTLLIQHDVICGTDNGEIIQINIT